MKAVIFAGGLGTRLSEETETKPKPMVSVGGQPLLWHIMKIYAAHGVNEFIVCLGYKGYVIKEYFINYYLHTSDLVVDLSTGQHEVCRTNSENWKVTLVETGQDTMTGGRLKRVRDHLTPGEPFCLTYGDGLSDVDITASITFHKSHGRLATVTAVQTPGRFGILDFSPDGSVSRFEEKPHNQTGRINGGFFVLQPEVIDYVADDSISWEKEPLTGIAKDGQLMAFCHDGFWQPCDTLRDKNVLEDLWRSGGAPWRTW